MYWHYSQLLILLTFSWLLLFWVDGRPTLTEQPCDSFNPSYADTTTDTLELSITTEEDNGDISSDQLGSLVAKKLEELDIKEIHQEVMLQLVLNYLELIKTQLAMPLPEEYYSNSLQYDTFSEEAEYPERDDAIEEAEQEVAEDYNTYVNDVNTSEEDKDIIAFEVEDSESLDTSGSLESTADKNDTSTKGPTSEEDATSTIDDGTSEIPTETSDDLAKVSVFVENDAISDGSNYWSNSSGSEKDGISLSDDESNAYHPIHLTDDVDC